jgi:hypothetical protein
MTQSLEPGVGLGSIKLMKTNLEDAVTQFGQPQFVKFTIGDESNQIVLSYFPEEVHLQFSAPTKYSDATNTACATTIAERGAADVNGLVNELKNMVSFLGKHPECKDIVLTSVTISAEERGNASYYEGKTDKGVAILDPVEVILANYGAPDPIPGIDVVSPNPLDRRYSSDVMIAYKSGIVFFFDNDKLARRIAIFPAVVTPTYKTETKSEPEVEDASEGKGYEETNPRDFEEDRRTPQPGL